MQTLYVLVAFNYAAFVVQIRNLEIYEKRCEIAKKRCEIVDIKKFSN